MSIVSEFKEFAVKGNVIDLAVGVIIGGAFGKIVGSVVDDLIMPIVGVPMVLAEVKKAGVPVIAYGNFITIALNFAILAFIIFIMIKQINKLKRSEPAPAPATPEDVLLLREIRDSLKK
jgi:large conductance mechanosensitive channel